MPSSSITTIPDKAVLQWYDSVKAWTATTVLVGVSSSTVIAGGTNGQALTSNGADPAKFQGMTTQGDVEYHNGTDRTRLAPGTSGQFLQTKGASANPVWASAGSIGVLKLDWANANLAAGQVETTMKTYTLPGGTLGTNDGLRITILYSGAGDNSSTLRFKFGATTVFTDTNVVGSNIRAQIEIYNLNSASSQRIISFGITPSSTPAFSATTGSDQGPSINTASDVTILITGETGAGGGMDVLGWTIEHIKT